MQAIARQEKTIDDARKDKADNNKQDRTKKDGLTKIAYNANRTTAKWANKKDKRRRGMGREVQNTGLCKTGRTTSYAGLCVTRRVMKCQEKTITASSAVVEVRGTFFTDPSWSATNNHSIRSYKYSDSDSESLRERFR